MLYYFFLQNFDEKKKKKSWPTRVCEGNKQKKNQLLKACELGACVIRLFGGWGRGEVIAELPMAPLPDKISTVHRLACVSRYFSYLIVFR